MEFNAAIIVLGNGTVFEQKLGDHAAGDRITSCVRVVSSTVAHGQRTVVLTRPFSGPSGYRGHNYSANQTAIYFIAASGSGPDFAFHKARGASTLFLAAVDAPSCVCDEPSDSLKARSGSLSYFDPATNTSQTLGFSKHCLANMTSQAHCADPYQCQHELIAGDLLSQRNSICDLRTYAGGLECCHHLWYLQDRDQDTTQDEALEYRLKFRFWFQEANMQPDHFSHQNLWVFYWQTEAAAGEYDVPKCNRDNPPPGQLGSECVHEITARWQVSNMGDGAYRRWQDTKGAELRYAGGHCHAPTCISIELFNADTGELLCRQLPVFGGRGASTINGTRFDEPGYIALPPCLFGEEDEGLVPPVFLSWDTNLSSVKRSNSTYGHSGEMASWQMRGVIIEE
jgi:hypothetical protein